MTRPRPETTEPILGGVLVTGAMGFVGSHLIRALEGRVRWLAELEHPAMARRERALQGETAPAPSSVSTLLQADITCRADVRTAIETLVNQLGPPQTVFHLAGQASTGRSFVDPAATYLANVVGTANLMEALADFAPGIRVLLPSTALVYAPEAAAQGALTESAPLGPTDHYGASKRTQEVVARIFAATRDLTVFITRAFNHLGPRQSPDFVLPAFARQVAGLERQGGGILRVGNLEARRDYLDVRDVVEAYLTVLAKGDPGHTYNVASGTAWSIRELLGLLLAESTVAIQAEVDDSLLRPVDVPLLLGDSSRLRALGWQPRISLRQTVRDTLAWWRSTSAAAGTSLGSANSEGPT